MGKTNGDKKQAAAPTVTVGVRLDPEMAAWLDAEAGRRGDPWTASSVARLAIKYGRFDMEKGKPR